MGTSARDTLGKVALVVVGTLVGLAAAEAIIRVTNGARYGERPTFYPRHERLGWSPAPGLDHVYYGGDYSIEVATDGGGRRLGRLGALPDDAERVILVGDSYTFGWGVSTGETYASQLDEILASESLRAANLGVGGYGTVQSALRLENYLREYGTSPVRAIVLLHSHNDPADNVTFETVRRGLREYVESPRNRGLHLHNLVRLLGRALSNDSETASHTLPGGHRDFAWTVGAFLTEAGRQVAETENPPADSDEELLSADQEVLPTYERRSLTRLQVELLRQSIGRINDLGIEHDALVLHAAIHTAPEWYLEPIGRLVEETGSEDPRVIWCGKLPADREYTGPVVNQHSGSHFTPPLNRYYAEKIAKWLLEGGCE